jgi:peroxiredoxin
MFVFRYLYSEIQFRYFDTYDFSLDQKGLNVGEIIPINSLIDETGKPLSEKNNKDFILLVIIDPECGACKIAKDQIDIVFSQIENDKVAVAFVSFTTKQNEKFFRYVNQSYPNKMTFVPNDFQSEYAKNLATMVVPSQILIDSSGKILAKFPGTNQETIMRRKMAHQIIKDVAILVNKSN